MVRILSSATFSVLSSLASRACSRDAGEQRRHIGNLGFTPGEKIEMSLENRRIPQGPARVHDGIHARFGEAAYTVLRREQVPAGDDG